MSTTLVKPAEVERKWYLLDAAGTVSYTHLDVYKRQAVGRVIDLIALFGLDAGKVHNLCRVGLGGEDLSLRHI